MRREQRLSKTKMSMEKAPGCLEFASSHGKARDTNMGRAPCRSGNTCRNQGVQDERLVAYGDPPKFAVARRWCFSS